jgi:hypothetical protein
MVKASAKPSRTLQDKLSESRATLNALHRERRRQVARRAYGIFQALLLDARVAGLDDREVDAIAYRAGQVCYDIEAGFPLKAGETSHG